MKYMLISLMMFIFIFSYGLEYVKASSDPDEPELVERVIKIEGTLERPRVIFIVPRARVWKEDISRKSFIRDILRPVYPEGLIEERR